MKQEPLKLEELENGMIIRVITDYQETTYVTIVGIRSYLIYVRHLINLHEFEGDLHEDTYTYEKIKCYALNAKDKKMVRIILEHEIDILDKEALKPAKLLQKIGGRSYVIKSLQKSIKEDE
jgi:flagellar motor component MotA